MSLITMSQQKLNRLEAIQKIKDRRLRVVQAAELLALGSQPKPDTPPFAGL